MSLEHPKRPQHIALGVLGAIAGAAMIVGLWFGGWALARAIRGEQNKVNRNSYEFQTTYATQTRSDILDVRTADVQLTADPNSAALVAQKKALVTKACGDAALVADKGTFFAGDQSTLAWVQANC